jgi:hypothetical protein
MWRYACFMRRHGMAFDDQATPRWPEPARFGVTDDQVWAANNPQEYKDEFAKLTSEQLEKIKAYNAADEQVRSWHGMKDVPGIPLHKFSTNDGWIVLPVECRAAVEIWKKAGRPVPKASDGGKHWPAWIAFLEGAARHDGFEVW